MVLQKRAKRETAKNCPECGSPLKPRKRELTRRENLSLAARILGLATFTCSYFIVFLAVVLATQSGGRVGLDFNRFGEMYLELCIFVAALPGVVLLINDLTRKRVKRGEKT